MPANKNALIRYKTIDNCLRNRYRRWTLDDLVEACSDALYDMEGITKGVCARTVQMDIQIMRSDKLGYNAPIEVYDRIYYRYADPNYSITEMPLSIEDCKLINKAIILLENKKDKNNEDNTDETIHDGALHGTWYNKVQLTDTKNGTTKTYEAKMIFNADGTAQFVIGDVIDFTTTYETKNGTVTLGSYLLKDNPASFIYLQYGPVVSLYDVNKTRYTCDRWYNVPQ